MTFLVDRFSIAKKWDVFQSMVHRLCSSRDQLNTEEKRNIIISIFISKCYIPMDLTRLLLTWTGDPIKQQISVFAVDSNEATSSYPGWIKSPHVVTLGILKLSGGGVFRSKLWSSQIWSFPQCWGGGYSKVNFGHPKSEVFRNGGGGIPE